MKQQRLIDGLKAQIERVSAFAPVGRVSCVEAGVVHVTGLAHQARIGDVATVYRRSHPLRGEVLQLDGDKLVILPDEAPDGVAFGDRVALGTADDLFPCNSWLGRIIDPLGRPLDGLPLLEGEVRKSVRGAPPKAAKRRGLGQRLATGLVVTNTLLPIVRGQRVGLFAGSGVGKSSLLGQLARTIEADVVVIAMIGERGREVRHFAENILGKDGLARAVIIAATSDQSPLLRRRCAMTAISVAEHFRDQGLSVMFFADSVTRFAEAHREVAVAAGEAPVLRGFPPSTAHMIMSLCERAGPGEGNQGDITGIFTVLVAGSDMEEPIADILRGVLDGHIVLNREIAERGRFPAIDVLRSVSRALPDAATQKENDLILQTRRHLSLYDQNEMMIRAGLYSAGTDQDLDLAVQAFSEIDAFISKSETLGIRESFSQLELLLRRVRAASGGRASARKS